MDNLDKYIDNLFEQKLSGASMPDASTGADWANIGKVLQKKAFLKFTVAKFNIYYLSTIIVAAATAGSIFIPPIFNAEPKEPQVIESLIIQEDTIQSSEQEEIILDSINVELVDTIVETPEQSIIEKEIPIPNPIDCETNKVIDKLNTDTCLINKKLPELELESGNSVLHEALVPVIKNDTIIQVDTLTITKKRLMLRRKK